MTEDLYRYLEQHNPSPHPILDHVARLTNERDDRNMQISAIQGSFLHLLASLIDPQRIVEVGCFTGYSAICLASGMQRGKLYTLDSNEETSAIAKDFFRQAGLDQRIELRLGDAARQLEKMQEEFGFGSFDLAFIDADKENYIAYYETCLKLLRPGGLIVVDNVLWNGAVINHTDQSESTSAIRRFNQIFAADERVTKAMIPVADGLAMAVKKRN
jgi:predicted O-methyltransferase YrrM